MQPHEMEKLAAVANTLRPDWPLRSLQTFIEKNLTARAYSDAVIAFVWVCTRTKTETPRLLLEAGPWWRATVTTGEQTHRPPRKDEACPIHIGSFADRCSGCAADQAAGDTTAPADPHRPAATEARALARAELAQITANLCRHKVDRARVRCGDCDRTPTSQETTA